MDILQLLPILKYISIGSASLAVCFGTGALVINFLHPIREIKPIAETPEVVEKPKQRYIRTQIPEQYKALYERLYQPSPELPGNGWSGMIGKQPLPQEGGEPQ